MSTKILYQGHASVRLETPEGKIIYVDPFEGEGYDKPADLILVTHQHFDHNQIDKPLKKEDTVILQNTDLHPSGEYKKAQAAGIEIEGVEAYNKNHPKEDCVGYVLTIDGKKIYIPGDTGKTRQMETLEDIDYAFLPIDGVYTMSLEEAREAAQAIGAKHVIPYHTKVGSPYDKSRAQALGLEKAIDLEPGQILEI